MRRTIVGIGIAGSVLCGCHGPPPRHFGTLVRGKEQAKVFHLDLDAEDCQEELDQLVTRSRQAGEPVCLWIDIARSPRLAASHPHWIAGMGSHDDWRRCFPDAPELGPGDRVGMYPWVPIWYRDVLAYRRAALARLLSDYTDTAGVIKGVFLNQVQGAPSACGCGNDQCRWTVDYRMEGGPAKVAGTPAALLVAALKKDLPGIEWIPVWVSECEEHDLPGEGSTGYCGGVECFKGLCWKESAKEMDALAKEVSGPIAILAARKLFHRELARYDARGGWLREAIRNLEAVPPLHGRQGWPAGKLIAVIEGEGRDIGPAGEKRLVDEALAAGVGGVLVSAAPFEESWEPRRIPTVPSAKSAPGAEPGGTHGHD